MRLSENTRRWVESAAGGTIASINRVAGATSSLLHSVEIETAEGSGFLVLRRFIDEEWTRAEPDVAIREARSLQHAARAGLPSPVLIAVDADGSHCGVPATLVTRVHGDVLLEPSDWTPWTRGLAAAAAQIHRVDAAGFPWKYRRYNERDALSVPRWSSRPEAWKRAIEVIERPQPPYRECFIHRDFHPSNVLWSGGRVTGIVDWVNGCRGPAGIDVAWCRHNLANLHGVDVADRFLDAYIAEAGSDFEYDPYWDLMSVIELLPGPPSMYAGWRSAGVRSISDAQMRDRVDAYVVSVVDRL